MNQDPAVRQDQQLGRQRGAGAAETGSDSRGICSWTWRDSFDQAASRTRGRFPGSLRFRPRSLCPPVRRCRADCQAGQKPERKFTLTPGKYAASHRATGRQQQSTCPGINRWRTINSLCSSGPDQILPHDPQVIRRPRQAQRAIVVAKFVIRQPDIEHPVEQLARLRRAMGVGLPHQPGVVRQRRDHFQCRGRWMVGSPPRIMIVRAPSASAAVARAANPTASSGSPARDSSSRPR